MLMYVTPYLTNDMKSQKCFSYNYLVSIYQRVRIAR